MIIGLVGVSTDVTSLSEADEEVRRREAQLAEAQALTGVGSWEWEVGSDQHSWSSETYRILGCDPAEFEPTIDRFLERVHPDDRERLAGEVAKCLDASSDGSYDVQHRVVWPDGEERVCDCRGRVFFDLDGTPLRMVGAIRDVTEAHRAEARLARSELQLRVAQELTGAGSWDWDPATGRLGWSAGMYRIFGLAPDAFDGTFEAYLDRFHPADRATSRERIEFAAQGGDHVVSEARILRPGGEVRVIRCRMRAIGDAGGPHRVIGVSEDVTDRKRERLELERRALHDPLTNLRAAERLWEALAAPFRAAGTECRLTASIGVAFAGARHETPEDILRDADRAMYAAKQRGGGRAELFTAGD